MKINIPFSGGANQTYEAYVLQLLDAHLITHTEAREALGIEPVFPLKEMADR